MTKEQEERLKPNISLLPRGEDLEVTEFAENILKIFFEFQKPVIDTILREQSERDKKETTSKLKEEILKMKKEEAPGGWNKDHEIGFNIALQEVLDLINKNTKE